MRRVMATDILMYAVAFILTNYPSNDSFRSGAIGPNSRQYCSNPPGGVGEVLDFLGQKWTVEDGTLTV